jgi:peroxiredoxin
MKLLKNFFLPHLSLRLLPAVKPSRFNRGALALLAVALLASAIGPSCAFAQGTARKGGGSGEDLYSGLPADIKHLKIGDAAPDFSLPGIDGRTYTLADFKDAPVLMVAFLSNHCPYSHAAETRLLPMVEELRARGLAVVAINPNHPDAVALPELGYSRFDDSFEDMKPYAEEAGFTFPYLYDGDTQTTAKAYGALATPHIFVLDSERRLRYAGRFDDSRFEGPDADSPDTRNAIEALLDGRPVPVEMTKPMGCSTKWRTKAEKVAQQEAAWKHETVTLDKIDAAGVAKLVANPTNKLRLINVWATWCAPCVAEFPQLVELTRRLGNRDFEIITISMDNPAHEERVLKFLQARHAGMPGRLKRSVQREGRSTNHYLYTEKGQDALVAALDPEWPGPLPHTVLIAPGGEIIWRHNGELPFPELTKRIFEVLGGYYR